MDSIKKMDIINVTALPMIAVNERMVVSVNARKALQSALRKQLQDHPPTCIVGSMSQVNQKITEIDLGPGLLVSTSSYCSDRELEKFLSSPFLSAIWLDSFWWIFHERYQPKKEIQNKLFDRIARNYAFLLFKTVRSHYEEALIKRLPSLLSKALYTSFCCCFPQSWFNTHEFKSVICNTMDLWISGTYPCPQSYDSWDYSELDPERFRREELMLQSSRLIRGREFTFFTCKKTSIQKVEQNKHKKSHRRQSSSLYAAHERGLSRRLTAEESTRCQQTMKDYPVSTLFSRKASQQVKRISETRACMSFCPKMSHPACKIPKLTSNKFNIYGNSPLIVYFFLNYSKLQQHGQDVLINRREKTKVIPDSAMTYADIIRQVRKNMETRRKKLRQLHQLHENEWTYFNSYLTELQENFQREVKIIDKKEAEKRKANHVFLSPSILFDDLFDKKSRGNPHKEMAFLSRKKNKDVEERQKILQSSFSFRRPVDNYSLGLKSPYRIASISSEPIASMSKVTQEVLFRLSPSSIE